MAGERSRRHSAVVPKLDRLHSPDLLDMQSSGPEDPESFCILVQAMIGPKEEPGEESFDFIVCTPKWLAQSVSENQFVFGRHYLIIDYYDYSVILSAINSICQTSSGSSWKQVAEHLSRYGKWEFEDYVENSHDLNDDP